jgi:predicted alpha/beta-hydrolase family hydrolase
VAAELILPLASGGQVSGRHYPAAGEEPSGLFVFAHGAGAGQGHPFMTAFARDLANAGVDVVTFNFPYMEARRKVPDKAAVLEAAFRDVVAAARARPALDRRALFIGGKSMGGRIATHLAAQGLAGLQGVVVLGYPLHPPGRADKLRTDHLPRMSVPALIAQGERDAFGTPPELAPFIPTMPAGTQVHVVAGGDHSLTVKGVKPDVVRATVIAAILEWMRERGRRPTA